MQVQRCLVVALALFGLLAMTATAETINFSGSTIGTFIGGAPAGVAFTPRTFSGDLLPGTDLALGYFRLDPGAPFFDKTFKLTINFTAPPETGAETLTGELTALVRNNQGVSFRADFNEDPYIPTPVRFDFDGGSFDLIVHDVTMAGLTEGNNLNSMGWINAEIVAVNTVPEPASLLLVGSALIGLGALYRRRRQN